MCSLTKAGRDAGFFILRSAVTHNKLKLLDLIKSINYFCLWLIVILSHDNNTSKKFHSKSELVGKAKLKQIFKRELIADS